MRRIEIDAHPRRIDLEPLGEIDDRWSEIFQASGQSYTGPKIVLFRNATNGGRCGMAQSAMGPFYCPPDKTIFLDTGFFRDLPPAAALYAINAEVAERNLIRRYGFHGLSYAYMATALPERGPEITEIR
mgnify:CR=1 FL=1